MPDRIDLLTAALADRYRIEHELGAGGMATVYLAEDLKRELFYRNGANALVAAEVVATPGFTVGTQRVLFSLVDYQGYEPHTPYAVSSDDQRFMMIRRVGGGAERVDPCAELLRGAEGEGGERVNWRSALRDSIFPVRYSIFN